MPHGPGLGGDLRSSCTGLGSRRFSCLRVCGARTYLGPTLRWKEEPNLRDSLPALEIMLAWSLLPSLARVFVSSSLHSYLTRLLAALPALLSWRLRLSSFRQKVRECEGVKNLGRLGERQPASFRQKDHHGRVQQPGRAKASQRRCVTAWSPI
jgi:hypothetical protein